MTRVLVAPGQRRAAMSASSAWRRHEVIRVAPCRPGADWSVAWHRWQEEERTSGMRQPPWSLLLQERQGLGAIQAGVAAVQRLKPDLPDVQAVPGRIVGKLHPSALARAVVTRAARKLMVMSSEQPGPAVCYISQCPS